MRGVRAKALRRMVYGEGGSSRTRQWSSSEKPVVWKIDVTNRLGVVIGAAVRRFWTGRVVADDQRRAYQAAKQMRRGQSWRRVNDHVPAGIW